jgi:hypothetical protein
MSSLQNPNVLQQLDSIVTRSNKKRRGENGQNPFIIGLARQNEAYKLYLRLSFLLLLLEKVEHYTTIQKST